MNQYRGSCVPHKLLQFLNDNNVPYHAVDGKSITAKPPRDYESVHSCIEIRQKTGRGAMRPAFSLAKSLDPSIPPQPLRAPRSLR